MIRRTYGRTNKRDTSLEINYNMNIHIFVIKWTERVRKNSKQKTGQIEKLKGKGKPQTIPSKLCCGLKCFPFKTLVHLNNCIGACGLSNFRWLAMTYLQIIYCRCYSNQAVISIYFALANLPIFGRCCSITLTTILEPVSHLRWI